MKSLFIICLIMISSALAQASSCKSLYSIKTWQGLTQVDGTSMSASNHFIVLNHLSRREIYAPYSISNTRSMPVVTLQRKGDHNLVFYLQEGDKKQELVFDLGGITMSSSFPGIKIPVSNLSLREQLLQAGFEIISESRQIFRFSSKQNPHQVIFAILSNNRISLLYPLENKLQSLISDDSSLFIDTQINPETNRVDENLIVRNKYYGFTIESSSYLAKNSTVFHTDLSQIPLKKLGIDLNKMKEANFSDWISEELQLKVGEVNSTESIKEIQAIAGLSISELEKDMRPGASSTAGFLGRDESLIKVLMQDNAYVVDELGLTHQIVSRPLLAIASAWQKGLIGSQFTYQGVPFQLRATDFLGSQTSPFKDGVKNSADIFLTNLKTGKKIVFSLMLPDLITRYGFYEGQGTQYRLEPKDIVEIFSLK